MQHFIFCTVKWHNHFQHTKKHLTRDIILFR